MGKLMSKIENIYKERLLDYERDIADLIQIIERLTKKQQSTYIVHCSPHRESSPKCYAPEKKSCQIIIDFGFKIKNLMYKRYI